MSCSDVGTAEAHIILNKSMGFFNIQRLKCLHKTKVSLQRFLFFTYTRVPHWTL